ncbi:MAG: hypothetical protein AB9834_12685 [Lentimicrobium sp.]
MKPKNLIVWGLALLVLAFFCYVVGLYFFQFKEGTILSDNKADWGTLGDYLSGIFAVFNLGVVVVLAIYVSNNDKRRSDRELEVQRKILISQLRFNELGNIERTLNDLIVLSQDKEYYITEQTFNLANSALILFVNQKRDLFPILESPEVKLLELNLKKTIYTLRFSVGKYQEIGDKDDYDEFLLTFNENLKEYKIAQYELFSVLQKFILDDLKV